MNYSMKAGVLYGQDGGRPLARIKGVLCGPEKQILSPGGTLLLRTDIRRLDAPPGREGELRYREYVMLLEDGGEYAAASPGYAAEDDPPAAGWPLYRMPRVDHALLRLGEGTCLLRMENSQNYALSDDAGRCAVRVIHRGIVGGWTVESAAGYAPAFLCGVFVFCRYIEQENEFLIV